MVAPPRSHLARVLILGAGGVGAILRGVAYLPTANPPDSAQLSPVEAWMPVTAWAGVWIAVGCLVLLSMVWRPVSITAMTGLTALLTLWGVSYIVAWAFMDVSRSWVTASVFLMAAVWAGVLTSLLERGR